MGEETFANKLAIVLCGDHGGELDRRIIEIRPDQDENAVIGNAVISAVEDWSLNLGDTIHIVYANQSVGA